MYVNGTAVAQATPAAGDCLRVGKTVFTVKADDTPVAPSAQPSSATLFLSDESIDVEYAPAASLSAVTQPAAMAPRGTQPEWRFTSLVNLGHALAAAQGRETLFETACNGIMEALDPDRGFVAAARGPLECDACGFQTVVVKTREGTPAAFPMSRSLLQWAQRTQKAVIYSRTAGHEMPSTHSFSDIGISDFLCMPYFLDGEFAGIFYFDILAPRRAPFDARDLEFAVAVGQLFTRQLENIALRERLQKEAEELRRSFADEESIVGSSPPMQDLFLRIDKVAPTEKAAEVMDVSRDTVYAKIREYQLKKEA